MDEEEAHPLSYKLKVMKGLPCLIRAQISSLILIVKTDSLPVCAALCAS